jgi:lipopolysaccharide/colanic/teichoic acid biosynthesis glycosyltransferase
MIKRLFDILFSIVMLLLLSPLLLSMVVIVALDSPGGVFFGQIRVGKSGRHFRLWKFRTMKVNAESSGQLTVGSRDNRITRAGFYLRKYKIDELPQLWNVLTGDMSIVGPRPEVPRYVAMYNEEQKQVLSILPGITDYASLLYFTENDLLAASSNPEETYIREIMPAKLELNLKYIREMSFLGDMKIVLLTARRILR